MDAETLLTILPSWKRSLRADNRQPTTIATYRLAVEQLHAYCEREGFPTGLDEISVDAIRGYLGDMLATRSSSSARQRYASLKQAFKWFVSEGLIDVNPMNRVNAPKVIEPPVPILTDDDIRRILAVCSGKRFDEVRDQAIIRLFAECGLRLAELVGLRLKDLDLDSGIVIVLGKGRKTRGVNFQHEHCSGHGSLPEGQERPSGRSERVVMAWCPTSPAGGLWGRSGGRSAVYDCPWPASPSSSVSPHRGP